MKRKPQAEEADKDTNQGEEDSRLAPEGFHREQESTERKSVP